MFAGVVVLKFESFFKTVFMRMLGFSSLFFVTLFAHAEFEISGYGAIDYRQYDTFRSVNDLKSYKRTDLDLAEFALEGEYRFTNGSELEFEIEIEHGGVGTAYEFDPMEEFGEFETELEKGGEVVLSEFSYFKRMSEKSGIRIGKFPVRMGLGSVLTNPNTNISHLPSRLEQRMIPTSWNELGFQYEQQVSDFTLRIGAVNGLNSEFFRTYNWIGGGYQRHFETINAEDKAITASVEYGSLKKGHGIAAAFYQGDSANNRYKLDKLSVPAKVTIYSFLANYQLGRFSLLGQYVKGTLDNSSEVAVANSTLGNLANPATFSLLGSSAVLRVAQIGYDLSDDFSVYGKHEYVNTFLSVDESVPVMSRYEVVYNAFGVCWKIDEGAQIKFEDGVENTELSGLPATHHFTVSFVTGFEI